MQERKVVVKWRAGLHARRAVDLVNLSNKYRSKIIIKKDDIEADAKSILNLMTLEASYKTSLSVVINGEDEKEAIKSIVDLFNNIDEK
jgi:phosphocarrier protein HPr